MLAAISPFKAAGNSKKSSCSKCNHNGVKTAISFKGPPAQGLSPKARKALIDSLPARFFEQAREIVKMAAGPQKSKCPIPESPLIKPTSMDPLARIPNEDLAKLEEGEVTCRPRGMLLL